MEIVKNMLSEQVNGENIYKYTLKNDNNIKVDIINLGAIITGIYVPDKNGVAENVIIGFDTVAEYRKDRSYQGAAIGRTAGRTRDSLVILNGETYKITPNFGSHNLHGGKGFDKKVWKITDTIASNGKVGIKMEYISADGEEGYPGTLKAEAVYTINNENELEITYSAVTDKTTVVNMTNHAYFNMSGNLKRSIRDQYMQILCDKVYEIDAGCMPTKRLLDVTNTGFDLRNSKNLGEMFETHKEELAPWKGYDHPFLLSKKGEYDVCFADYASGRKVTAKSNQTSVVFYSGNQMGGFDTNSGAKAMSHSALCMEFQNAPDILDEITLNPGETYMNKSVFKFGLV